jgi:hypothetical protein
VPAAVLGGNLEFHEQPSANSPTTSAKQLVFSTGTGQPGHDQRIGQPGRLRHLDKEDHTSIVDETR